MADDLEPNGADEPTPPQPENTAEIRTQFAAAARVGNGILAVNQERREQVALHHELLPVEAVQSVRSRGKDEPISADDIYEAKRGSVAISLEASRQIQDGDLERRTGIRDDLVNLEALHTYLTEGSQLYTSLAQSDSSGVEEIARRLIGRQLGVVPEAVQMSPEQIREWADERYHGAANKLGRSITAMREISSTRF